VGQSTEWRQRASRVKTRRLSPWDIRVAHKIFFPLGLSRADGSVRTSVDHEIAVLVTSGARLRDCGYKRVIFELFCQFLTVRMWLPRGKIGFSEVARRSGAFSVSRPFNLLTGHTGTARTSAGSLRGYRRIGRSLREYVPDTRREHGDGRFDRGGGRRAVSSARRDFPSTEETCRRPNRSAVRIRDGYRTASVTLDRYGRRGGASATGERLGARFPSASETSSRAVPVLLRSRPRRTARCLTPRAVMDPTAYPDGRWSVGSHASPGTRRIAQGCV
jgi:hypothetical protein